MFSIRFYVFDTILMAWMPVLWNWMRSVVDRNWLLVGSVIVKLKD